MFNTLGFWGFGVKKRIIIIKKSNMVLAIMQAAAADALTATDAEQASFFGYIGIAIALCFASK